jgi:hypothetical protein
MTVDHRSLSLLIHSPSKTGKTTLGATAPLPICILDAEGGSKFLPGSPSLAEIYGRSFSVIAWNPAQPPPLYDGTWDAAIVSIHAWQDVQQAGQWLASGQHHFTSLVVDSITEIQRRLKKNLVGTEQLRIQDWGRLLTEMDDAIRGLRDMTINPHNPIRVVVFIAETRQTGNDQKWRPSMQGQIGAALPYLVDITGYLFIEMTPDAQGQPTIPVRKLLVNQHPQFEAGERVQGLVGPVIDNPRIYSIVDAVYPNYQPTPQEAAPV